MTGCGDPISGDRIWEGREGGRERGSKGERAESHEHRERGMKREKRRQREW